MPPQTIGGEYLANPQMAMDRDGNAAVLFGRARAPFDRVSGAGRPAGGDFSEPVIMHWLRTTGVGMSGVGMAYDWRGRLVIAWNDSESNELLYVSRNLVGELVQGVLAPGRPYTLSTQIQADALGHLYAIWWIETEQGGCCYDVTLAEMELDGHFAKPRVIAHRKGGPALALAVAASGAAVAAWPGAPPGNRFEAVIRPPGNKDFGAVEEIPDVPVGIFGSTPELAIDAAGEVLMVVKRYEGSPSDSSPPNGRIDVVVRPPDGQFGKAQTISVPGSNTSEPSIVAGPAGEAVIAWVEEPDDEESQLRLTIRGPDGSFSEPETIARGGFVPAPPALGMDAVGNAILAWAQPAPDGSWTIVAAHRPPHGRFGGPVQISGPVLAGEGWYPDPRIAVGGPGNAIVTWTEFPGGDVSGVRVDAAVFDIAAPRIPKFGITPAPGRTPGIEFRWRSSEVARVAIDLRRGTKLVKSFAVRAKVGRNRLVYRPGRLRAGAYSATLSATDRLGHRSKLRQAAVQVKPR